MKDSGGSTFHFVGGLFRPSEAASEVTKELKKAERLLTDIMIGKCVT